MQGRKASLQNKVVWRWWRHHRLTSPSHGGNTNTSAVDNSSVVLTDTFENCIWWGAQRSIMGALTLIKLHPSQRRGCTTHSSSGLPSFDPVGTLHLLRQARTRATAAAALLETSMCCGTGCMRSFVLPSVSKFRTVTAGSNVLGFKSSCLIKQLATGRAGMHDLGDTVMRHRGHLRMEAADARTCGGCCFSRGSPKFSNSRCLSYSSDSFFGSSMHNVCQCSAALKADIPSVILRSKEGTFSNVTRRSASAGDSDFADNLDVAPVELIRRKTLGKDGSLSARFINPVVKGAIPEVRLIHATAIVHPDALLGKGVEIGPFCTVGPRVKLGDGCKLQAGCHIFGETQLGEKCLLSTEWSGSGAVVGADIPGHTRIGDNNTIGHYAVVGVKCQDMKYKEGDECFLYIGNNNDVREFASIHRSSKPNDNTVLGNDNLIMGSCHVAHDCKIGNRNILANGTLLGGHVIVEDLVHTGGGVAVHQFCNIGSYSFLAGGSMVDRDVPMFMMVAGDRAELRGLNLEGMRRCGFLDLEVRRIRKAYQKLFMSGDSNASGMEERLSELEQNEEICAVPAVRLMLQSVRGCFGEKRRGICRFRHWTTV